MKLRTRFFFTFTLLIVSIVNILPGFAQDYSTWGLPEGAKARLGKGIIADIAYSPDGAQLAVATTVGIWIYDAATYEARSLITTPAGNIAYSSDGSTLASTYHGNLILWDAVTNTRIKTLSHERNGYRYGINSFAYSPDGTKIAVADGKGGILWNVETDTVIATLDRNSTIYAIAFSLDGSTIASGHGGSAPLALWDGATGTFNKAVNPTDSMIWDVAFSPDSTIIACATHNQSVVLWDVAASVPIDTLPHFSGGVHSFVAYSPDGKTITVGGNFGVVSIWDANTGNRIHTLGEHLIYTTKVYGITYSPDSQTVVSGCIDGTVRFYNTATGALKHTITGHSNAIRTLAYSPDGNTLAVGGDESIRTAGLWDVATHTYKHSLEKVSTGFPWWGVDSLAFSPDGTTIAGAHYNKVWVWDAKTHKTKHIFDGHNHHDVAYSPDGTTFISGQTVAFSPDGTKIVSPPISEMAAATLRDVETGRSIKSFRIFDDFTSDKALIVWDVETQRAVDMLPFADEYVHDIAYSPDGIMVAAAIGSSVYLWDATIGRLKHRLTDDEDVQVERERFFSVAFSSDGTTLASGDGPSGKGGVHLWDVSTGTLKNTLYGHSRAVVSLAFSPDGQTLASGSHDGTVLFWDMSPSDTTDVTPSTPETSETDEVDTSTTPMETQIDNTTVDLSPKTIASPNRGEQITFSLNITSGANVAGYQATLQFDTTALKYVQTSNSDYLPSGAFAIPVVAQGNTITFAASSLDGESSGDGTLAIITFEVIDVKASTVTLSDVLLTDSAGTSFTPQTENVEITKPTDLPEDVNEDGVVNIVDLTLVASNLDQTGANAADVNGDGVVNIADLTLVAAAFGNTAAAPLVWRRDAEIAPTRAEVASWLRDAQQLNLTDTAFQRGIQMLKQLLAALTPKETALLPNYPNPFNPETWIPYQLATPADVTLRIYAMNGTLVRTLTLGHQPIGIYQNRTSAAYWNGKNAFGEPVASGAYFYTLTAGNFTATRKMLILK